jgi:hypothetical protein
MHILDFNNFHKAIVEVLEKIHPGKLEDGWKMLGVHSNKAVSKRMSKLGVPSYLYKPSYEMKPHTPDLPEYLEGGFKAPTI